MDALLKLAGLRFPDAAAEAAFRRDYAVTLLPIQRAGLTLGLVVMALFIVRDIELTAVLGTGPLTFRLFVIIPYFAVSLALTFTPWAIRYHQPFFFLCALCLIGLTFVLFSLANSTTTATQGTITVVDPRFGFRTMSAMLLMFGVVLLSGLRFEYALLCGVAVMAGWWFDGQTSRLDMTLWRPSFTQIIGCFLLSGGAAYWIERVQREQFTVRRALDEERAHTERLLSYAVPKHALERMKRGEQVADAFLEAVVLFVDLAGFTDISKRIGPRQTVRVLDRVFTAFDDIVMRAGLERVKTMGDGYLVIGGAGDRRQADLSAAVGAARQMIEAVASAGDEFRLPLALRVGLHVGPVIGGVIGRERPTYDYWGDTLNIASRLEVTGEPGEIHCSEAVYWRLRGTHHFEARGPIELKGYSRVETYYVSETAPALQGGASSAISLRKDADG